MPDDFDRAQQTEQMFRDDALRDQALRFQPGDPSRWQGLSALRCLYDGCGEPIPEQRRKALPGVKFCVECQQRLEKKGMR